MNSEKFSPERKLRKFHSGFNKPFIQKELPTPTKVDRPAKEIIDINDARYKIHWVERGKLGKILRTGIYSQIFANRIGDREYTTRRILGKGHEIFLTDSRQALIGVGPDLDLTRLVGIVVESSSFEAKRRIAPRKFLGLIVFDEPPRWATNSNRIKHEPFGFTRDENVAYISRIFAEEKLLQPIPIYNQRGDVFWPNYISYGEILRSQQKEESEKRSLIQRLLSVVKRIK